MKISELEPGDRFGIVKSTLKGEVLAHYTGSTKVRYEDPKEVVHISSGTIVKKLRRKK